jgi:hypothetical protein
MLVLEIAGGILLAFFVISVLVWIGAQLEK